MSDFKVLIGAALLKLGAQRSGLDSFTLATMAGPLHCKAEDGAMLSRFERADFASGVVQAGDFNPSTGHWNFVFEPAGREEARAVFVDLAGVLPALPQYGDFPEAVTAGGGPVSTILSYFYRDQLNSKVGASVVFAAEVAPRPYLAQAFLRACRLRQGVASMVPGQVGLKDLQASFLGCEHVWDPAIDHSFHEISGLSWTHASTPTDLRTFSEFVNQCIDVVLGSQGWDEGYRPPFYEDMKANFEALTQRGREGPTSH